MLKIKIFSSNQTIIHDVDWTIIRSIDRRIICSWNNLLWFKHSFGIRMDQLSMDWGIVHVWNNYLQINKQLFNLWTGICNWNKYLRNYLSNNSSILRQFFDLQVIVRSAGMLIRKFFEQQADQDSICLCKPWNYFSKKINLSACLQRGNIFFLLN